MIKRKRLKTVLKIAGFSVLAFLVGIALFIAFWFKAALEQSEPVSEITIVLAAAKLERSRADIVSLGPNLWLKRAYKNGIFQKDGDALDKLLAQQGWKHTDEEGSVRIYAKGRNGRQIACQMYSVRYEICKSDGPL
jgi:hypothetical protein